MTQKKLLTSSRQESALVITAMVGEMAAADGWNSLDECMELSPDTLDAYMKLAEAALRALRRIEISYGRGTLSVLN